MLRRRWPKAAELLPPARDDILAYTAFPKAQWSRIYPTNPLERLNGEIRRRTNVVGVLPHDPSVTRLAGTIPKEIDDEWPVDRPCFGQQSAALLDRPEPALVDVPAPFTSAPIR